MIQPPTTGPTVGASTARTPAIVVASGWSRIGKRRKTAEKTTGIRVPPENPCTMRHEISGGKFPLSAQAIDANVNIETATTNNQRIVSSRVRNPVSGIAMISAIKYDVWIPAHPLGHKPSVVDVQIRMGVLRCPILGQSDSGQGDILRNSADLTAMSAVAGDGKTPCASYLSRESGIMIDH